MSRTPAEKARAIDAWIRVEDAIVGLVRDWMLLVGIDPKSVELSPYFGLAVARGFRSPYDVLILEATGYPDAAHDGEDRSVTGGTWLKVTRHDKRAFVTIEWYVLKQGGGKLSDLYRMELWHDFEDGMTHTSDITRTARSAETWTIPVPSV